MNYWILLLAYLLLFLFLLKKLSWTSGGGIRFRWLALAFVLKVACGLAYGYMDWHSPYGGDGKNYFNDSYWIHEALAHHPKAYVQMLTGIGDTSHFIGDRYTNYLSVWKENDFDYFFNDSRTVIRMHAFIRLFSFGNYGVHVLVFTFLSLIGQLLLFRTFRKHIRLPATMQFVVLFFFPSSLVWFSGILKEPVVMLGLGLLFYSLERLWQGPPSFRSITLAAIALLLLLAIRFYAVLCLLPGLILMAWLLRRPGRVLLKSAVVFLVLVVSAASFDYFATDYKFSYVVHDQMTKSVKAKEYYNPGTVVTYDAYKPNLGDILLQAPKAFLRTLAAPIHRVFSNPFRALFFLENIAILLLVTGLFFLWEKPQPPALSFLAGSFVFLVLLFVLIGLTTPFEGTMIRLRSIALPFGMACLLSMASPEKLKSSRLFSRFFQT